MLWVLDASTLVASVVSESVSHLADELLMSDASFIAPTAALPECANALLKKVRHSGLSDQAARDALHELTSLPVDYVPLRGFEYVSLFETARSAGLTAHDAVYLSLAESRNSQLITADDRLVRAVAGNARWHRRVVALADWAGS